ncbi:RCC1 domain-containing protein 1, partial [Lobosporangium transversale]
MLLCFGFRTKLVPETAARMLFAGWASFVIEDINGEIKVCGDYSPEEASLVETFCSKYSKSSEPGSQGLKANSLKFLGQEALQGFLTSTGEVFVKSNKDSGDEKLRGGPCLLLLSNIKDVATCGQSANHWTVAIDRSTGGLFEWIATDLRPRVVTLASSLNPLLPSSSASNPTLVSKTKFKRVWAGEAHMLVLAEDGTLYSWGRGRHGQLGHGDLGFESVPRPIEALQGLRIIDAACGASFSVALSESGDIYTFGLNDHGQLGIGKGADFDRGSSQEWESQTPKHNTAYPQLVDFYDSDSGKELDVHVVKVACGRAHTVVLD